MSRWCNRSWIWNVGKYEQPLGDEVTLELKLTADEPEGEGIEFEPPKKKLKLALQPVESATQDDDLVSLLNSGEFSDVTFVVGEDGTKVKAHKGILAARSKVFARMLKENEAHDGEIKIDDMGAQAFKILLRFVYSGRLDFPKEVQMDSDLCMELVEAGDKYDMKNFKEYAAMSLTEFVSLENALELFKFVKLHKAEASTNALRSYFVRNVDEIVDKL